MSVEDLMDNTKANIMADREGMDRGLALQRVRLDKERKALEEQKAQQNRQTQMSAEEQRRKESIDRFVAKHPNLDAKEIPKTVWEAFAAGKDMEDAWAVYQVDVLSEQIANLNKELESTKQNAANKARSTGSRKSVGSRQETEQDAFDKLWYDGT